MTSSSEAIGQTKKSEFLLELFSEEIPARMQAKAAADLKRLITDKLKEAGLRFEQADAYVTPRRLCLHIAGLDSEQPDTREDRRGPRADAPEQAIEGFLRGAGVIKDQVEIREEKKGTFLYAVIKRKGRKTSDVLAEFLPEVIKNFPWPKSQRWGANSMRWVRPLHNILCLLNDGVRRPIKFEIDGLYTNNRSRGHRFLAPNEFEVFEFADYQTKLNSANVILNPADRKELINEEAHKLAKEAGLNLLEDEGLLNEVVGLAEYPVVLMGEFDEEFLDVPQEALTSAMKSHQKYFSLLNESGKLANKFIFVSNMKTEDQEARIIDGNERVLRARLADTKFFWDQDLKHPLEDNLPKLNDIVFHAKLGSVHDRVKRLVQLSGHLAGLIGADVNQAKRAAELCKADLVSGMVGEFADLQGLMGKYYAEKQGEVAAVATAIAEHYSPKGPSDECPSDPVSVSVAVAEKIVTLVSFFWINEKPTGSKDPFALRRAALGIIRLIIENKLRLSLQEVLNKAIDVITRTTFDEETHWGLEIDPQNPKADVKDSPLPSADSGAVVSDLMDFFADRLKVHLKVKGVRHDLITAVFSLAGEDDLVRIIARVEALQNFLSTDEGEHLLTGFKRAANILKAEEKKDGPISGDATAGTLSEEKELFERLGQVSAATMADVAAEEFEDAMGHLATLRPSIDAFFDKVTVNSEVPEERQNRLRLLAQIRSTMNSVADFSKIEG